MRWEDYNGAISAFDAVIKLKPRFEQAFLFRGLAKSLLKDYKDAVDDLNRCIALNPKNGLAYLNRGAIKIDLNDNEGACSDFQTAFHWAIKMLPRL
jgi:tetratricopeptide (TPR) repeat protein